MNLLGEHSTVENGRLLFWLTMCACVVLLVLYVFLVCQSGHATEFSISGNSTGMGAHVLIFAGNVSASLIQGLNGSSWVVNATGVA